MNKKIIVKNTITLDIHGYNNIPIIVRDKENILAYAQVEKLGRSNYSIRSEVIKLLKLLIVQYNIDTIIFEQNKLFIDKIDRHPDPIVYRNILCGFGIQIAIEDNFYNNVTYIFSLPNKDWQNTILNSSVKYSVDLYKAHILKQSLSKESLNLIDKNNYYKTLCLSESIWFPNLMNVKYQINKN